MPEAEGGFAFTPLVVLGAGRSGTNMLRDALVRLPGFATWSCDEINPIWRHHNLDWPDDALPPERARGRALAYIRRAFARLARQSGARVVVEKTCANTLRVGFVAAVLPEARFVHLVRDGHGVLPSAIRRWQGKLEMPELGYVLAKARHAPAGDLPLYAARYIRNRVAAMRHGRKRIWGPHFPGMGALAAAGTPLEELCARQWAACTAAAADALAGLPADRQLTLRYEDVTADPAPALARIAALAGETVPEDAIAAAATGIRAPECAPAPGRDAAAILAPMRARLGYGDGP